MNFLQNQEGYRNDFYQKIKDADGDTVLITGDIAESHTVIKYIEEMQSCTGKPVYFVLGNHDFYGSGVVKVRRSVKSLGYLGSKQIVELGASTALIGVDGWGDCRYGDYENSRLTMSDWWYIDELRKGYGQGPEELKKSIQKLADADARKLKRQVLKAIKNNYTKIIIATHVPAFEEVCKYAGRKSTPDGLPFFSSKCLGDAVLPIAKKYSRVDFLWLSGHTHSRAHHKPCNNMVVKVAKAAYYCPQIEEIISVSEIGDI